MICIKNLRFSSRPGAKVGCQGPPGCARAQPCIHHVCTVLCIPPNEYEVHVFNSVHKSWRILCCTNWMTFCHLQGCYCAVKRNWNSWTSPLFDLIDPWPLTPIAYMIEHSTQYRIDCKSCINEGCIQ